MRGVGDRAAKLMRYIARALALIWAGFGTLLYVVGVLFDPLAGPNIPPRTSEDLQTLLYVALIVLLLWGGAAIPWRWEAIGGVVLILEGLLAFIAELVVFKSPPDVIRFTLVTMVLPPLVAGLLFLASWWRSRRAGSPQNR